MTKMHHDFDHKIRAWQHEGADEYYTLWITRVAIEDTEPLELVEALNRLKVAEMLRERPEAYTLVKSSRAGVVVEQLPGPPS